jgi:chemotaxis protein CheD
VIAPEAHSFKNDASGKRWHVVQGEFAVTDDPEVMLGTILGSCVAACMYDPVARVGGMNHFLLPGEKGDAAGAQSRTGPQAMRYGVQSMELLLNALYRMGARRERLQVKLFGGARVIDGLSDVGQQNAAFAERFVASENLTMTGSSLRGDQARRIQFWPVSGRVRQMALVDPGRVLEAERTRPVRAPAVADDGELELF